MNLEETFEENGVVRKGAKDSGAKARGVVHEKEAAGHEARGKLYAAVSVLVEGEVVSVESFGECGGLAEGEAEAGAGDGVDRTGGVADESDVVGGDSAKGASEGDRSAWSAAGGCCCEMVLEGWEVGEGFVRAGDFLI